ncbi:hypothetical protein QUF54_00805 [Candidatus Marithioploca araucensis]|uniref:Uncharacterized protein n=1 Tax=Candidatus Marithioploca araucensis TaxID=70273 RepID=A0ABT7VQE7_9GAMM|nr:hypothetical protein [Candidatus Marithioploca araucensis]
MESKHLDLELMTLKRRVGRSETETHHTVTLENGGFPLRSYPPYIT